MPSCTRSRPTWTTPNFQRESLSTPSRVHRHTPTQQASTMSYSDDDEGSEADFTESEESKTLNEIVNACKYGNLKKVKEVIEREEDGYALTRDEEGHSFVHWAALGGYNEIIEYLLDCGAPLNEHSNNDYGPKPIHWACVNGHVIVVELFLDKGVDIDTTDFNGCSPLLVAAQYGQSLVVSYLLQKGANKFLLDINGDSALHWGAFKGHPEVVFVLLNAGLNPKQKDSFGQTPLHSASIKGDIQCAEMLLEHGAEVEDPDNNSKTPKILAQGRRHRQLVKFLDTRDVGSIWDWRTLLFGPPNRSYIGLLFFLCCMFFWSYPMYFIKAVPVTMEPHWNAHMMFWVLTFFFWIFFLWSKFTDPGFIPSNRKAYEEAVKMIGNPTAWGDYTDLNNPIYNMCHTCKTVRPVRAKHCRQCDRCVEEFDHHCPWIDACIGRKNRVPFTIFLYLLMIKGGFVIFFSRKIIEIQGADFWMYFGLILFTGFFIGGIVMVVFQSLMIFNNLTTNERANYRRYRHFRTGDGKYRNPFDRGVLKNCLHYWNLVEPPYIRNSRRRQTHIV